MRLIDADKADVSTLGVYCDAECVQEWLDEQQTVEIETLNKNCRAEFYQIKSVIYSIKQVVDRLYDRFDEIDK